MKMLKKWFSWYSDACDWFHDMASSDASTNDSRRDAPPEEETYESSIADYNPLAGHETGWEGNLPEMMERGTAAQKMSAVDDFLDDQKS